MERKLAFQLGVTAALALTAVVFTGRLEQLIAEPPPGERSATLAGGVFDALDYWKQIAFVLLAPAAFGVLLFLLPGERRPWWALAVVAGCASFTMALFSSRELTTGRDLGPSDLAALRWYLRILYFGGGMLIPLTLTIGLLVSRQHPRRAEEPPPGE